MENGGICDFGKGGLGRSSKMQEILNDSFKAGDFVGDDGSVVTGGTAGSALRRLNKRILMAVKGLRIS